MVRLTRKPSPKSGRTIMEASLQLKEEMKLSMNRSTQTALTGGAVTVGAIIAVKVTGVSVFAVVAVLGAAVTVMSIIDVVQDKADLDVLEHNIRVCTVSLGEENSV